jgi:hypothetical protein
MWKHIWKEIELLNLLGDMAHAEGGGSIIGAMEGMGLSSQVAVLTLLRAEGNGVEQ